MTYFSVKINSKQNSYRLVFGKYQVSIIISIIIKRLKLI